MQNQHKTGGILGHQVASAGSMESLDARKENKGREVFSTNCWENNAPLLSSLPESHGAIKCLSVFISMMFPRLKLFSLE